MFSTPVKDVHTVIRFLTSLCSYPTHAVLGLLGIGFVVWAQKPPSSAVSQQFQTALAQAQQGHAQDALASVESLLGTHPDFMPALKLEGRLLEKAGRSTEARTAYEHGLRLAPNDQELLLKTGKYQIVFGDNLNAVSSFERLLRVHPGDADALFYLAVADHALGQNEKAKKAIGDCLRLHPRDPGVWQNYGKMMVDLGNAEEGYAWLVKAQSADPGLPDIAYDLGEASFQRMDFTAAESALRRAAAEDPNDDQAWTRLGSTLAKLSKWKDAKPVCQHVLERDPGNEEALFDLGHAELELREYQDSIDTLIHLLRLNPKLADVQFYLSKAYAGLGNTVEAKHHANLHERMMDMASFSPIELEGQEEHSAWAAAQALLAAGHDNQLLRMFQQANPRTTPGRPYFLLGVARLNAGDSAGGIRDMRHALELDPNIRGPHTFLGILDREHGKLDEAEKEFELEIANDPTSQDAEANLGVLRNEQKRWTEAAELLTRSRTRNPMHLLVLCDVYFHLGDTDNARLTAELVAAYADNDAGVLDSLGNLLREHEQTELANKLESDAASRSAGRKP